MNQSSTATAPAAIRSIGRDCASAAFGTFGAAVTAFLPDGGFRRTELGVELIGARAGSRSTFFFSARLTRENFVPASAISSAEMPLRRRKTRRFSEERTRA